MKQRQILWDQYFQDELEKEIASIPIPGKHDWKKALDDIVNKYFPGTGDNYRIVFDTHDKKSKKRKIR